MSAVQQQRDHFFAPFQHDVLKEKKAAEVVCSYTQLAAQPGVYPDLLHQLLSFDGITHERMLSETVRLYKLLPESMKSTVNYQLYKISSH